MKAAMKRLQKMNKNETDDIVREKQHKNKGHKKVRYEDMSCHSGQYNYMSNRLIFSMDFSLQKKTDLLKSEDLDMI